MTISTTPFVNTYLRPLALTHTLRLETHTALVMRRNRLSIAQLRDGETFSRLTRLIERSHKRVCEADFEVTSAYFNEPEFDPREMDHAYEGRGY